ncbi:MAG: response regulator [Pseudomonadaceae bacterium]|nr:response regulator [Pseudomonadaceae bacterium]
MDEGPKFLSRFTCLPHQRAPAEQLALANRYKTECLANMSHELHARFNSILMVMPNMDGYTAIRLLKQEHGCIIPIIALTAHALKGDREKCLAVGADDYLAKPIARQELLNRLYRWLNSPGGGSHAPAE